MTHLFSGTGLFFATICLATLAGCSGVLDLNKDGATGADDGDGTDAGGDTDAGADTDSGADTDAGADSGADAGADSGTGGDDDGRRPTPVQKVDLLLILDNSASMETSQRLLASVMPSMVQQLTDEGLDVRVGMTTTDSGNSGCATTGSNDTTPEHGGLRATSCTTRPMEFEFPHPFPVIQAYEATCTSICPEDVGNAWSIIATGIEGAVGEAPRPWLEVRPDGETNVTGATWAQALRCMVPQGVDGCGFEAQLESHRQAIAKSSDPGAPHFGFMRDDAMLALLHFTNEADCSSNTLVGELVFGASAEDSPLWTGPSLSSGVCWKAGTTCVGDGMPYESCEGADLNYLGEAVGEVFDPEAPPQQQQVLVPLSRFQQQLDELPHTPVVAMFAGVPHGYADGVADISYSASEGSSQWQSFGVDFGCESEFDGSVQRAVPPVRLREMAAANHDPALAEASGLARNIFSLCDDSFSQEAERVVELILAGVARTSTTGR